MFFFKLWTSGLLFTIHNFHFRIFFFFFASRFTIKIDGVRFAIHLFIVWQFAFCFCVYGFAAS